MTEDPLLGTVIAGSYRVDSILGEGGMGRVYAGEDLRLGRRIAIKVLLQASEDSERALRRFQREARAIASLGHQHIVTVFDIGTLPDDQLFLVMEHLEGETLQAKIRRQGALPLDQVAAITRQTSAALRVAHAEGIVHRDLKPENVMLISRDHTDCFVKVLDFGLAKSFKSGAAGDAESITQAGSAIGTPAYMSPEQARGDDVDHRADVYALGMVAYAMLCGRPAFVGKPQAVLISQAIDPPPTLRSWRPDLSLACERIVLGALAKSAADRPDDIEEFAVRLESELMGSVSWTGARAIQTPEAYDHTLTPTEFSRALMPSGIGEVGEAEVDRPTTLSSAVGEREIHDQLEISRRSPLGWTIGGLAIAAVAGLLVWATGGGDDQRPAGGVPERLSVGAGRAPEANKPASAPPPVAPAAPAVEMDAPASETAATGPVDATSSGDVSAEERELEEGKKRKKAKAKAKRKRRRARRKTSNPARPAWKRPAKAEQPAPAAAPKSTLRSHRL